MHRELAFLFIVLICPTALSACGSMGTSTPMVTVTAQPSEPAATSSPTTLPSPTLTATLPPTPTLDPLLIKDFIISREFPDCQLPCWEGLRIGVSKRADVLRTFDRIFGFGGYVYPPPAMLAEPPSGYELIGHMWEKNKIEAEGLSYFTTIAILRKDTDKLEELRFVFGAIFSNSPPDMRIEHILTKLGEPSHWFMSFEPGIEHVTYISLIVYDSGVSFTHTGELRITGPTDANGAQASVAKLCLGDYNYIDVVARIGEPLADGLNNLSPIQKQGYQIRERLSPIQEHFNLSLADIVQRTVSDENFCFTYPDH